jgi:DNA polymerase-3 subunit gamma/tau
LVKPSVQATTPPPVQESEPTKIENPPAEPIAVKPAAVVTPIHSLPQDSSGLSAIEKLKLKIANEKQNQQAAAEQQEAEILKETTYESIPLTTERFALIWNAFLEQLAQEKKMSLHVIFKNATWQTIDDCTIELTLASTHEKEMFEEERINIVPGLRQSAKNSKLDFIIRVNSNIQKTRVFTSAEKFKAMAERNPTLLDLKNLLELEF